MANKGGVITRKEIITDDAINWGPEYQKTVEVAIGANKVFADSLKEIFKHEKNLKELKGNKSILEEKQKMNLLYQEAVNNIKLQEQAEISANKIKKSGIDLLIAERREKNLNTKATLEERIQQQLANKAEKEAALEKLGLVGAYQKLNKERTEAKNKLRDLIAVEGEHSKSVKIAQKEYDVLDARVRKADNAVRDFTKNVGNYPSIGKLAVNIKDLLGAFGLTAGIAGAANVLKGAFDTIVKFDQALADLRAITGATGEDFEFLKKQAIELGKTTKGGAVQVVEAYKLIASAKPELLENVEALNQVTESTLILSKAAGIELPEAATALTDAMNQFGAPAEEASRFIDALANGAKYGSAEIPQVTEALLKFGAVAKSSNISIEESTALIELLAEKGLKGAEAGTALRNVLLKISAPDALPKEALAVFDKFGISIEKLKDNTIPIQERLELLKPVLGDNANLVKIFGQENIVAARNVLANTDRLKDLTSKMYEYGTAQKQADERSNTLQGKTERLKATYDSFILSLNSGKGVISDTLGFLIEKLNGALEGLIRINASWDDLYKKAQLQGKNLGQSQFEIFSRGLSPEEVEAKFEKFRKSFFENRNKLEEELKKNEEELAKKNPYGLVNPFGKSIKDYKKEIERLKGEIAQIDAFLQAKGKFVNKPENTTTQEQPKVDAQDTKDDKKAEEARKKSLAIQKQLKADEYELLKQRLEQRIQISNEIAKNEEETDDIRLAALAESLNKEKELLKLTKDYQLSLEKLTYKELLEENKDSALNVEAIKKQHGFNVQKINEEFLFKTKEATKKTQEEIDKINQFDEAFYKKQLESKLATSNIAMNAELQAENERFKNLGDLTKLSLKEREKLQEEHEKNVLKIKKKYAIEAVKLQISNLEEALKANDSLDEQDQVSGDKRLKIAEELSQAKLRLSELEVENNKEANEEKTYSDREWAQAILDVSQQLASALGDLTNAIFDARIQRIDEDIQRTESYYQRQIELAGNDERQKKLLQEESEKKRKILEDKKRKEQHKQAVFNKALSAVQVGISTAMAIMQSYAQMGPIAGSAGAVLAGVMGAIQLAAVLAAPIPKYKHGRKGGPAEFAEVGDGYISEVVKKKDGRAYVTPNKPTLTWLDEGDTVYSSIDKYKQAQRASFMASINMQGKKMSDYQAQKEFDKTYEREMLEELKKLNKSNQNKKPIINNIKIDLQHYGWKNKNTNWN